MKSGLCLMPAMGSPGSQRPTLAESPVWAMGSPVSYPTDSFPGDSRSPEEAPPHPCSSRSETLIVKVMPRNQLLRTAESLLGLEEGV